MRSGSVILALAVSGLVLIMVATIGYASGIVSSGHYLNLLLAGTLVWFAGIIIYRRSFQRNK